MIHTAFISDFYHKLRFICYIQTYISFVASFIHIWMVLAFTAERFFAVSFPLKHMSQCTPNVSRGVILIIIVPAFVGYIHPAFFVSDVDNKGQCREKDGYERYLNNLNIIDTIMTMFIPLILVSILNILIIRKLFCSKTFRQHVFANGSRYQCRRTSNWTKPATSTPPPPPLPPVQQISSSPSSNVPQSSPLLSYRSQRIIRPFRLTTAQRTLCLYRTFTNSESSQININNNNNPSNEHQKQPVSTSTPPRPKQTPSSRRNDSAHRHVLTELRLTKMLLAISLTCLSLNFPSYYLRLMFLYEHSKERSPADEKNSNEMDFAFYRDVIFHYMSCLSYSINIVIYLLFGGNFRRALKRLFSLTSSRSKNLNSNLGRKKFLKNDKNHGNMDDYDSTGLTSLSPNSSLRSHSKSLKLREQASLRRTLRQQQLLMSQQNKTE
jgi:hypothetical protein